MDDPTGLAEATRRLTRTVDGLDDADYTAPTVCAGWSRRHVIAHLALNAEGLAGALRGTVDGHPVPMYRSQEARDRDIEDLAGKAPAAIRGRLLGAATDLHDAILAVPDDQVGVTIERVHGGPTFAAADGLARSGETLQNLLTENETVAAEVQDEAWTDLSYSSRPRPLRARTSADGSRAWIESQLRSVRVDAPKAVILSSGSGRFAATVTNGLDQPVSVRVQALSDPPLKVAVPKETIELGSESKTTVLLSASSSAVGIRNVTLLLTDTDDVPLGSSDDVPIRSNRVSNVIWLIVGTGVALLFGAIIVRLLRRIRAARRTA